MTLTDFLLARIAEDEEAALGASHLAPSGPDPTYVSLLDPLRAMQQRFDPARVLAECEAKRRIVKQESGRRTVRDTVLSWTNWDGSVSVRLPDGTEQTLTEQEFHDQHTLPYASSTLRLMALPYADHPDYQPDWKL